MRRPDPRSAGIRRPAGVTLTFQVSENSVEPPDASRARNLLSKNDWRAALADEGEPDGPEVALVGESTAATGCGERLARATAGPNRLRVRPSRETERVGPRTEAGEEVALSEPVEVNWFDVGDRAGVNGAVGDMPGSDKVANPVCRIRLQFVVERGQSPALIIAPHGRQ